MAPDYDEDDREEVGGDPIESEPRAEALPTEADVDREEDEAEAAHEAARAGRAHPAAASRQQPAGEDPSSSPYWTTLSRPYQEAIRAGTLTVDQAVQRQLNNTRQQFGRLQRETTLAREAAAAAQRESVEAAKRTAARVGVLLKALGVEEPEATARPPLPAADEDLAGHLTGRLAQIEQRLEQGQEQQRSFEQERAAREEDLRQVAEVEDHLSRDYQVSIQAHPDYEDAEQFVVGRLLAFERLRIHEQFPDAADAAIEQEAQRRLLVFGTDLQLKAWRAKTSLADAVYSQAVKSGYRATGAPSPGNGRPAAAAAPSPSQQRLAQASNRRNSARTIAGTPPGTNAPSEQDLVNFILNEATDEEFDEIMGEGEAGDRNFRRLMSQFAS